MKKYEYENATVYITIPNEKHLANIRRATEEYLHILLSKGIDICEWDNNGDRSVRKNHHGEKRRVEKTTRNYKRFK